jgi:hypothetical protein
VGDEPEKTYKVGEMFIETPNQLHAVSRNASDTKPAKLLAVMLSEKGKHREQRRRKEAVLVDPECLRHLCSVGSPAHERSDSGMAGTSLRFVAAEKRLARARTGDDGGG